MAILDYVFDFSKTLTNGDSIVSFTVDPAGLTLVRDVSDGQRITIWISGGVAGQSYSARCTIVTANGRTDVRTMTIRVQNT